MILSEHKEVYQRLLHELDMQTEKMTSKVNEIHREGTSCDETAFEGRIEAKVVAGAAAVAGGSAVVGFAANPVTWIGAAGYALLAGAGGAAAGHGAVHSVATYCEAKHDEELGREKGALAKEMEDGLLKRLAEFAGTMAALAGFFEDLLGQVESLRSAADRADAVRKHYLKIRNKASILHSSASKFIAAVPTVQSQLKQIPSDPRVDNVVIEIFGRTHLK